MKNFNFKLSAMTIGIFFASQSFASTTALVSSGTDTTSQQTSISYNGQFAAFVSKSGSLVGDSSNTQHVYIKDLINNTIQRASVSNTSSAGNDRSYNPIISGNGRFVVYHSKATNLGGTDGNGTHDVYRYDTQTGKSMLVTNKFGSSITANGRSNNPSISADGRYIAFESTAKNLLSSEITNDVRQVYIKDMQTGDTKLVSVHSDGLSIGNELSFSSKISGNGRYVVFSSRSTNLDSTNSTYQYHIYLHDRQTKTTKRITSSQNNNQSLHTAISDNGNIIAYTSRADNIVENDNNGWYDIFIYNQLNGETSRISAIDDPNGTESYPQVSGNGRFISFASTTTNFGIADNNDSTDLYVYDRIFNTFTLASTGTTSNIGKRFGTNFDGTHNVFSTSSSLSSQDNDSLIDVYLRKINTFKNINPTAKISSITSPECSNGGAYVTLNGSNTIDPSGEGLTYSWTGPFNTVTGVNASVYLAVGTHTVTLKASNYYGSHSTSMNVTVSDTLNPSVSASAPISLEATSSNGVTYNVSYTSNDACKIGNTSVVPSPNYTLGYTPVTVTAFDSVGRSASDTTSVTVVDTTVPVLTIPANKNAEASAIRTPVDLGNASATDFFLADIAKEELADYPLGTTDVKWTATDTSGNSTSKIQKVTIGDTTKPVLTIPANQSFEATAALSSVDIGTATATDIFPVSINHNAPAKFSVGTTPVTWTANDGNNSISAIQQITLTDNTAPTITAPADITVEATAINTPVTLLAQATASDLVGVKDISSNAPAAFTLGTTDVTWTATDEAGNSSDAVQKVTVEDTTAPVISTPVNIEVEATGVDTNVDFKAPTATDIFDGVVLTNDAPTSFPVGPTTITWTAVDASGNSSTATQTVTVNDTTAPVIKTLVNVEIEATAFSSILTLPTPIATDIVGVVSIESDAPASFLVGTTTVTWTAKDAAGNETTATQTVTVNDTTPADLTVPANMTVEANGNPSSIANLGTAKAIDIVDGDISANVVVTEPANGYQLGNNTVGYSITDKAGNVKTGSQTVTMVDTTAPVFDASNVIVASSTLSLASTIEVTSSGTAASNIEVIATGELTEVIIGQAKATDHYLYSVTNDNPSNMFPVGETVVTWTAEDTSGNKSTYTQTVVVSYQFNGYASPLKNGGVYKSGRVIPVKINITYADGTPVEIAQPQISVFQMSNQEVDGVALDIASVSAADNGTIMRHTNNGDYIYNLDTKSQLLGKGTFQISVLPHEGGNVEVINIALK